MCAPPPGAPAPVADQHVDFLLIGGGTAGASCARTLREKGAGGPILLVGRELDAPYHRPPATKDYLRGERSRADALIQPAEWWEEHGVELRTRTSVLSLDPAARTAKLSTKDEISYDQALLATGAMVRRLGVDGADLEGIHYIRALGNADAVRRDVAEVEVEEVVVVGGSYLACEVAASLTAIGKSCTMVMQEEVTLERGFGRTAGGFFHRLLEEHGVRIVGGDEVERFEGEGERVTRVVTRGGRELAAGAVVAGVGAVPDVMLARRAGLEIGHLGGVRTDARLETSAPGLFAAGDMCEYDSVLHGRVMRIEHEDVAFAQGASAARSMLGSAEPHTTVPYFFSDLADWASLEYVGPALAWDEEVVRGDIGAAAFSVFYLGEGRVRGVLSVDRPEDLEHGRRLLAQGGAVDESLLRDPAADLSTAG